ncbi:TolB protein [Actinoplanes tereljensis]|uniref:TolB protein n=1 Tax=Paractinoplanes tereljensis TaxID=571912 RepID=A0A919NJK9_9ACTN|nr:PD40 domain-containing protein [Actinoplanes tereljensis]GIF19320.1 hypothetical protein Ate02nite_20500 [Actinoplanes tereljensis]
MWIGRLGLVTVVAAGIVLVGPTGAEAAFPGRNGRIAFQRESVAGDHTQTDLWTIGADGKNARRLTNTPGLNELAPAWNGAGTKLVFWRTPAPFGHGAIWTMDADGRHQKRLTTGMDARDPVWNRQGTRIIFTKVVNGGFDLWVMRSDGSGKKALTRGAPLDFEAAWSPDGKRVAFTRGSETGDVGDIFVLTLATGKIKRVTKNPDYDHQVAWSPDGKRLVFERDTLRQSSIWTINPDGTKFRRLTTGNFFDLGPAWSPDGRYITFGTDRTSLLGDLWLMRADGTAKKLLYGVQPAAEGFPDWQPRKR